MMVYKVQVVPILWFLITTVAGVHNKPHIWLILTDDQGVGDIGYNFEPRNKREKVLKEKITPTLDKLAKDGLKLDSMYCSPLCGPSRGSIMTGRAPYTAGYGPATATARSVSLPDTETLLFEVLKGNNYHNALVGKFGISFCDQRQSPLWRGFDNWIGPGTKDFVSRKWNPKGQFKDSLLKVQYDAAIVEKKRWFFHYAPITQDRQSWADMDEDWEFTSPENVGIPEGKHLTHVIGDETVKIVNSYAANIDRIRKPLFLMTAFRAPHTGKNRKPQPPKSDENTPKEFRGRSQSSRIKFLHMVRAVDDQIAKIVNALKMNNLWKDTFIIFLSDGGGLSTRKGGANNLKWIGGKNTLWEGGIRVPSFVRGTDSNIAKTRSDSRSAALQHCMDIFPTIIELAQLKTGKKDIWKCKECTEHQNNAFDGISQWSNWKASDSGPEEPRKILVHGVSSLHKQNFDQKLDSFISNLNPFVYDASAYVNDNYLSRIKVSNDLVKQEKSKKEAIARIKQEIELTGGGAVVGRFTIAGTSKLLKLMFHQRKGDRPWHNQAFVKARNKEGPAKLPNITNSRLVGKLAFLLDVTTSRSEGENILRKKLDENYEKALIVLITEYENAVERSVFDIRTTKGATLDIAQIDPIIQIDSNDGKAQYFLGAWGGRKDAPHSPYVCEYKSRQA